MTKELASTFPDAKKRKRTGTIYFETTNKGRSSRRIGPRGVGGIVYTSRWVGEIMRGIEYKHVYVLRNKDTGYYPINYWVRSQKHKALFSTRKKAEEAVKWIDDNKNIEIVEL